LLLVGPLATALPVPGPALTVDELEVVVAPGPADVVPDVADVVLVVVPLPDPLPGPDEP
jgi:hypothetical protein